MSDLGEKLCGSIDIKAPPPQDSLSHYGIKGQKWGIRRFQFDNGSYTPEGKERYGRGSSSNGKTGGFFAEKKWRLQFEIDKKNIGKDIDESIKSHQDDADRIDKNGKMLSEQANTLADSYKKQLKSMKLSNAEKEKVWDGLLYDFGNDGTDDRELYELAVRDRVDEAVYRSVQSPSSKKLKAEQAEFDRALDQYWKDVQKIAEPVLNKYQDKYVKDLDDNVDSWDPAYYEINKQIGAKLDKHGIGQLTRNFHYLVIGTPEYTEAVMRLEDEFPFEEYEKRLSAKK